MREPSGAIATSEPTGAIDSVVWPGNAACSRTTGAACGADRVASHATEAPTSATMAVATIGTARPRARCGAAGIPASSVAWAASISRRASPASASRRFRSFSRHRRSKRLIEAGVSPGSTAQSGSPRTTAAIVSVTSSQPKARRPVSISNTRQPNAQISARLSTACPRACSGAIYAAVPRTHARLSHVPER